MAWLFVVLLALMVYVSASAESSPSDDVPTLNAEMPVPDLSIIDVMLLQDTSELFEDGLKMARSQLGELHEGLKELSPDFNVGVAEFKDKPFWPLGGNDNFCYRLGDGRLSNSLEDLQSAFDNLIPTPGGDERQAHFQALIDLALDPQVHWRTNSTRVIILVTNSLPHLPGDIQHYSFEQWQSLPFALPPNPGIITNPQDTAWDCLHTDYPAPEQVKAALAQARVTLLLLTTRDPDILPAWTWLNREFFEQPSYMYQFIEPDMRDYAAAVLKILESFSQLAAIAADAD